MKSREIYFGMYFVVIITRNSSPPWNMRFEDYDCSEALIWPFNIKLFFSCNMNKESRDEGGDYDFTDAKLFPTTIERSFV